MANDLVQIKGFAELDKMLQQLPANIERNVLRGGLRAGMNVFKQGAKERIPSDFTDLIKSLKVKTSGKFGMASATLVAGNKKAYYAHWVEYGTASYYAGKGRSVGKPYEIRPRKAKALADNGKFSKLIIHPGVRPHPYMRVTVDQDYQQALTAMRDYMRIRIEKEMAKFKVNL